MPGLWYVYRAGCPGHDRGQQEPPDSCADRQYPAGGESDRELRVRQIYGKIQTAAEIRDQ